MKSVLAPLQERGYIFRRLEPFSPSLVGSRKRIKIYHGIDMQKRYLILFAVKRKSTILLKDVTEWLELKSKIENYLGYPILQNLALFEAPICSKAKRMLESEGWKVIEV
ncbi:MAG: hypothetical protein L3J42_05065 [Hydrogenimonas sp.]|nr:hypothetical protein [Hydrogenimonas sp.]